MTHWRHPRLPKVHQGPTVTSPIQHHITTTTIPKTSTPPPATGCVQTDAGKAELVQEMRRAKAATVRTKILMGGASPEERRRASAHDVFDSFDLDGSGTIDVRWGSRARESTKERANSRPPLRGYFFPQSQMVQSTTAKKCTGTPGNIMTQCV